MDQKDAIKGFKKLLAKELEVITYKIDYAKN
jgi:hypothetical protein